MQKMSSMNRQKTFYFLVILTVILNFVKKLHAICIIHGVLIVHLSKLLSDLEQNNLCRSSFVFLGQTATYAIEDPGYPLTHHVFFHNNRKAIPIHVDDEGMDVQSLQQSEATIAYVTPSHQFPTGTVLSAARRTALLNWASSQEDHFIIEDDYDSEFRYAGRPIPVSARDGQRR